jgi:uncharacterized protein (DUF305 family)
MVPHHEQALEMVDIAEGRDLSPAVADLVERIGAAQAPEVARMQGWLEQWADDEADEADEADEDGHMGDGMGHGMGGMDDRMDDRMDGDGMHGDGDGDHMDGDHMGGVTGMAGMPGMATPAELAALEAARGRAFERMWLAVMVQHHEGAIAMAEQELQQGEDPAALDLARSITASQQAEVDEMRDLLDR